MDKAKKMIIKKFGRIYEDEDGQLQIKDFDIAVSSISEFTDEGFMRALAAYLLKKAKVYDEDLFPFSTERTVMMAIQKSAGKQV